MNRKEKTERTLIVLTSTLKDQTESRNMQITF